VTPIVTYILRCNTDVTSLLSGTAIKAIVAYISDYVTKPGLKTYSIFDAIGGVFDRNSEMLGGSLSRKEKARRLVTKIVNSLTAKMEIGGPMASLYLLGNPDHYTSHKFVPVYWKNYVREAMKSWRSPDDMDIDDIPEKVVLQKSKNQYVGISTVYDYIYRPKIHSDKTLYEWIQMAKRVKKPTKSQKHDDVSNGEDELDLIDSSAKQASCHLMCKASADSDNAMLDIESDADELNIRDDDSDLEESDSEYSDSVGDDTDGDTDDESLEDQPDSDQHKLFLEDHPLHDTHMIQFKPRKKHIVPNFIGGSLPRRDCGDREYYCATMLTLFKPWRNGTDLKSEHYSWDETFMDHEFTPCQQQLMDHFNIRYECNDA
jgi:hypothetical protein